MRELSFGASTWFFQDLDVRRSLQIISECGYRAAEIWMEHLWKSGEDPGEVRETAGRLSLSLSLHAASYDLNIASSNPGIRRESRRQVEDSLQTAVRLGAGTVVVHAGRLSSTKGDVDEHWGLLEDSLRLIDLAADGLGLEVAVEAMEKRSKEILVFPEEIRRLMSLGWKRIGITLDLAHIASVMDHQQFLSAMEGRWLRHVHLSDYSARLTHLPLGRGELDIDGVLRLLAARFRGTVILEGFVRGQGLQTVQANAEFLRRHGWMG